MRILIALTVCLVLGLAGLIGFVVMNETGRDLDATGGATTGSLAGDASVATISHGERVDVSQHVATNGYTIVMFTADW